MSTGLVILSAVMADYAQASLSAEYDMIVSDSEEAADFHMLRSQAATLVLGNVVEALNLTAQEEADVWAWVDNASRALVDSALGLRQD
jgi:hypothetical protein